jgi:hypothetical protein
MPSQDRGKTEHKWRLDPSVEDISTRVGAASKYRPSFKGIASLPTQNPFTRTMRLAAIHFEKFAALFSKRFSSKVLKALLAMKQTT